MGAWLRYMFILLDFSKSEKKDVALQANVVSEL